MGVHHLRYEKTHPNRCCASHCRRRTISSRGNRCIRRVRPGRRHSHLSRPAPSGGYPRHHSCCAWYLPGSTRASWHYRWLGTTLGALVGAATRFGARVPSSRQHSVRHGSRHLHDLGIVPRTRVSVAKRLNKSINRVTMPRRQRRHHVPVDCHSVSSSPRMKSASAAMASSKPANPSPVMPSIGTRPQTTILPAVSHDTRNGAMGLS